MEIEFDPAKEAGNIAKHGVFLKAAEGFYWDTAFEREDDRLITERSALSPWGRSVVACMCWLLPKAPMTTRFAPLACADRKHEVRFYHGQV
jgi:uncharacterized DUF497 family protein